MPIQDLRLLLFPPKSKSKDFIAEGLLEKNTCHPDIVVSYVEDGHLLANDLTCRGDRHAGVFATSTLAEGTFLGEYVGEMQILVEESVMVKKRLEYGWKIEHPYFTLVVDASEGGNELAMVNDYRGIRESANIEPCFVGYLGLNYFGFRVKERIEKGEELLINYGEEFF